MPIPSSKNKYEIDSRGNVRNARTKRKVKPRIVNQSPIVNMYMGNGKYIVRSIQQLMFEVHGVEPTKLPPPVTPVWIFKGTEILYFANMKSAAVYLSAKLFYRADTIRKFFTERKTEIKGWKIKYCEEEPRIFRSTDQILGSKYFHRENKYWAGKGGV